MKRTISFLLLLCMIPCFVLSEETDDYVCAQLGDSGVDVEIVLHKCAEMGFIKDLPEGADEYLEEYSASILAMEKALGFTEDGIIHLSEFEELELAVCVGSDDQQVKQMLEWLYELGYITQTLPEPHTIYEKKYETSVKNAERKLGLQADGILLKSEQSVITKQKLPKLDAVKTVSAYHNNGKVTVNWSAVKGAVSYTIYKNGTDYKKVIGKTSFVDENAHMGDNYEYYVKAVSYLRKSDSSKKVSVEVPIKYISVTLKDLRSSGNKYLTQDTKYVKLGNMKVVSLKVSGKDLKIDVSQKIGNVNYSATLIMEDYKNWTGKSIYDYRNTVKTVSGQAYVESAGYYPVLIMTSVNYSW